MIISYLYSMGFSIIFTYRVSQYCGDNWNGCFIVNSKTIVISGNTIDTFWHEVGHAFTHNDKELYSIAEKLEAVKGYQERHGKDVGVHEFMATIYSKYKLEPEYVERHYPSMYVYFKNKYSY